MKPSDKITKMSPERMAASGISEPEGTGFSIIQTPSKFKRQPSTPVAGSAQTPAATPAAARPANANLPAAQTPTKPLFSNPPQRPNMGFEAFLSRGLALSGSRRSKGGSKKPGGLYKSGPFKGLNQGQAIEKARDMYGSLDDSVRKKYEERANMKDVRSDREVKKNEEYQKQLNGGEKEVIGAEKHEPDNTRISQAAPLEPSSAPVPAPQPTKRSSAPPMLAGSNPFKTGKTYRGLDDAGKKKVAKQANFNQAKREFTSRNPGWTKQKSFQRGQKGIKDTFEKPKKEKQYKPLFASN